MPLNVSKRRFDNNLERCTQIEKENRMLLQKMTNILTSAPTYKPGSSDNLGPLFGPSGKNKRAVSIPSLNRNSRQRDLEKIMAENEYMLKRLQE
jgi:hypothetical protein